MTPDRAAAMVRVAVLAIVMAAGLGAAGRPALAQTAAATSDLQAAFVLNFARFTEWPSLRATQSIAVCVFGDDRLGDALRTALRDQTIGGRRLVVSYLKPHSTIQHCQVLFVARGAMDEGRAMLERASSLPILTVGNREGFAASSGIIELFQESGRMRFAVNVDAAEQSRLRLSSRLLGLAKIVRGRHAS